MGNVGFAFDGNLIRRSDLLCRCNYVMGRKAADTITVTNPGSIFTVADAVVYSGLGAIDGSMRAAPQVGVDLVPGTRRQATTRLRQETLGYRFHHRCANCSGCWLGGAGGVITGRPYTMFIDQVATSTTANASWTMNTEGWIGRRASGFKRFSPPTITRGGRINRGVR